MEPLVNELYAQVRPVKLDSAGSKPSKEAVDLAQGPCEKTPVVSKSSSLFSSFFSSSKKTAEPTQPIVPEKVYNYT